MRAFKSVLVDRHIGAVLVGFVLAQGVASIVELIMVPVGNAAFRWTSNPDFTRLPPIFPPSEIFIGLARSAILVGVGFLILKWLYLTEPAPHVQPETSDGEEV